MKIALVGSGLIGHTIAKMLAATGDYDLTAYDRDPSTLATVARLGVRTRELDLSDSQALRGALAGHDAVLNALPYYLAIGIANAAKAARVHYFDLTEDVRATHAIRELAADSKHAFMPQCGLAPGFIGIAAHALAQRFDTVCDVRMRVGALPQCPTNALKYNLTWSVDGLINEYCQPCDAIRDGRLTQVHPLEGLEHFSLDGVEYEAFNTSGGLGTLCETLAGSVETLDYKSVRYPGHRDLMKFLLDDLRLSAERDTLKHILQRGVPTTTQDVVLIFITVTGMRHGQFVQEVFSRKIFARDEHDGLRATDDAMPEPRRVSAIQLTTAGALCAVLDLFREGRLPQSGFIRQEQVDLQAFLENRFGRLYAARVEREAVEAVEAVDA